MEGFLKEISDFLVWIFIAPILWFIKRLVGKVDKIEEDLKEHKEDAAKIYVPRSEIKEDNKIIHEKLDKIHDRLMDKY